MESDAPWVIRDTSAEPEVRDLAVTAAGRFGAYIGVPVHLPGGRSFGHLVDAEAAVVLVLDPSSLRVVHANRAAARLAGTPPDDLVGSPPWRAHPCWAREELVDRLAPLRVPGASPVEYVCEPVEDAPVMDVHVQRVATSQGDAVLLWTGHDIGVHRRAEEQQRIALAREREAAEQFRRLDALRQAFLSAVSHELRTPLTTVVGALETVCADRVVGQARRDLLDRALVNAGRLDRLLEDLLDLNRFSHGARDVGRRQEVRLDEVVRRAVEEVEVVDRPVDLDLVPVTADVAPVKVERIVFNLVRNAVVHTPPGTPVRVHLTAGGPG